MAAPASETDLDTTLAALADPVRRRAIEVLGEGPRRSGELAEVVGVSPATMSKHLRVLRRGGLVTQAGDEVDTRVRIYSLASAPMVALRRWLKATEQAWAEELGDFAAHLRATGGEPPVERSDSSGWADHAGRADAPVHRR